jgi:hypothetical protein
LEKEVSQLKKENSFLREKYNQLLGFITRAKEVIMTYGGYRIDLDRMELQAMSNTEIAARKQEMALKRAEELAEQKRQQEQEKNRGQGRGMSM